MLRVFAVALLAAGCTAQDYAGRADALVKKYSEKGEFTGAVLVARDGVPLFRSAYGSANAEWNVPNTADTKFRIGSLTKQFTAVAILQLVEQGRLRLDESVRKYYPEAPESWAPVTIAHLLNHTSGIFSYTSLPDFMSKRTTVPLKPAEILALTHAVPVAFKPGEGYVYNNSGYVLLGLIIEKVTGKSWCEHLQAAVLEPAGLASTGCDTYAAVIPKRASGYIGSGASRQHAQYLDMSLPYAGGALYSTVDDLARWDRALESGKLLSEASRKLMYTPGRGKYGFGWVIDDFEGRRRIHHAGGIFGFTSQIMRFPGEKLVVVVLSNNSSSVTGRIAEELARLRP